MSIEIMYDLEVEPNSIAESWEDDLNKIFLENGFNILDKFSYDYPIKGKTVVFIISESHIVIHTWPEINFFNVNFFMCHFNNSINLQKLEQDMFSILPPLKFSKNTIQRGPP